MSFNNNCYSITNPYVDDMTICTMHYTALMHELTSLSNFVNRFGLYLASNKCHSIMTDNKYKAPKTKKLYANGTKKDYYRNNKRYSSRTSSYRREKKHF